ncbi:MAG: hypothetical protein L0H31_16215 [Nocardioidaceae bacterium]|nr:hypothetical protein [Nocardioidaceae bacterium]
MSENHGRFDASNVVPSGPTLGQLVRQDAQNHMLGRLSRISERIHHDRDREADEPLDPEIIARLEQLCAADDAPLEFRSLARRVREGRLTWKQYWDDPRAHGDDTRLIAAVVRDIAEHPPIGETEGE